MMPPRASPDLDSVFARPTPSSLRACAWTIAKKRMMKLRH